MKFQALGSNYSFSWSIRQLFAIGSNKDSEQLKRALEKRYGGHAYLYAKGRDALSEAVRICMEDGSSQVVVNGLTCSVVVEAIEDLQATPLYLDVEPTTAHFNATEFAVAIKNNPDICAVIVQNTYGRVCDIEQIESIARARNIVLIEDLAHGVGQTYPDGREVGTVGDLVMLSFGRDKLIDVVNGGALVVRSTHLVSSVQPPVMNRSTLSQLRDRIYPIFMLKVRKLYDITIGKALLALVYKSRLAVRSADGGIDRSAKLPHWQAKLALARIKQLDQLNEHRRARMNEYERYLGDSLISKGGTIRGAVQVNNRQNTLGLLRDAGYELSDTWYDSPIGPSRKYEKIAYPETSCPNSVELSKSIINLPTHSEIDSEDTVRISEIVRRDV